MGEEKERNDTVTRGDKAIPHPHINGEQGSLKKKKKKIDSTSL